MTADELVEALRSVGSATVANAVDELAVRLRTDGYADVNLRCLVAQPSPMVGYAVTFEVDSTTPGSTYDSSGVADLVAAVRRSPKPCVVVAQEAGPFPDRGCHMGDVVGAMLAREGVVGVVSGSGIRDLDGIRSLGLSAFARGTVVGRGTWTITGVGAPVEACGLTVRTGDLLHGDGDGVVQVPVENADELMQRIEAVQTKESAARRRASDH